VVTASGRLENNDLILLGTGEFFKLVPSETIQMAMASQTAQQAVEILAPVVHSQSESSLVAAVVAKAEEKVEKPAKLKPVLFSLKSYLGKLTRRAIFLRSQKKKRSKKTLLTVALVLFLLLVMSVVFGRQQRSRRASQEKINQLFEEARFKKEEAEALIELNPVRAKELLLEAQSLAQQIESEADLGEDFSRFKEELNGLLPQVLREHEVQPSLLFDLVLIKDKAMATETVIAAEKLVVLDKEKKAVYQLDLAGRKSAILAGGEEFKTGTQLAAFGPQIFVLTEEGIIEIEKDSKKPRLVVGSDEDWGKIIDFQTFAGNLYLLTDKTIWQHLATESGFGVKKRWLKDEIDFSLAVSMAIDGSIWVLQTDGTIVKLTRGQKDPFGLAGLDKAFTQPQLIFTDDNCQNLYILDKGNRRVVVLEKSGEYHSQYMWEGIKDIDGLVVSEKEGKVFLWQGNQIYEIELK
jgi:F0F1-type ATP synthase membrane subunit b/b'